MPDERNFLAKSNQSIEARIRRTSDYIKTLNSLHLINIILIGMTEMLFKRIQELQRVGSKVYFDTEYISDLIKNKKHNDIWTECAEISRFNV